jgi:16S rRNA processing protein RimM
MDVSAAPVIVARIIKPHGIHGEVVVESWTDVEGRLEQTESFHLLKNGADRGTLQVESRRFFRGRYALRFRGITDRNGAEKLRGLDLAVPESDIGELPGEHYFIHDLIGMAVRLKDGRAVGNVQDVLDTGGAWVLEVGERGEILIPFVDRICVAVDLEARQITIDPPEGLLQLNEN